MEDSDVFLGGDTWRILGAITPVTHLFLVIYRDYNSICNWYLEDHPMTDVSG